MKYGTNIEQRDIVLIPFPYSNLTTNKKRPVVIISNKNYNDKNKDIICCAITSKFKNEKENIIIEDQNLETGKLKVKSAIKPEKIYSLFKKRIIKIIGKLKVDKSKEIIKSLNKNIEIDEPTQIFKNI